MSATATGHNRLHQRAAADERAIHRLEEAMAADLRQLERDMKDLDASLQRAQQQIEQRWRQAHLGYGPNRAWAWPARRGDVVSPLATGGGRGKID